MMMAFELVASGTRWTAVALLNVISQRPTGACALLQVSGLQLNVARAAGAVREWAALDNPDLTR